MSTDDVDYFRNFQRLVDKLVEKTTAAINSGQQIWENIGPDTYELSLTRTSVRIGSRDADGEYPYVFDLLDAHGKVVESLEDIPTPDEDSPVRLRELYELVSSGLKRKAVENALEEALFELEHDEPSPF